MIQAIVIGAIAFAITLLLGGFFISLLSRLKVRKEINVVGPESHNTKAGTPTMGGILIIAIIIVVALSFIATGKSMLIWPTVAVASLAILGVCDDFGSIQGRKRSALNKRLKFLAFLAIGLGVSFGIYYGLNVHSVNIPFAGEFDVRGFYIPIATIIIILTSGGVAVSDGLDGLAVGSISIALIAYGILAITQDQNPLAAFCFATSGASLGFLWHNSHPAKVFMGDVGALALGGALATASLLTEHWLILPLIGVVFLLEGSSDVIQIIYFRLTNGKRILKMAPLHHHFELLGWSETQVVQRFWLLGALGAAVGIILALEV